VCVEAEVVEAEVVEAEVVEAEVVECVERAAADAFLFPEAFEVIAARRTKSAANVALCSRVGRRSRPTASADSIVRSRGSSLDARAARRAVELMPLMPDSFAGAAT
jgi:hypothetical protein